jgi:hypothetical protein
MLFFGPGRVCLLLVLNNSQIPYCVVSLYIVVFLPRPQHGMEKITCHLNTLLFTGLMGAEAFSS